MVPFKIFYAWQSDRPAKLCRTLIQRALDDARKQVKDGQTIDVEPRIQIEIDQDTQGVPGSPHVAETIFEKIQECDAFIADLTFTGCRKGKRESPVPNPNVLIEYGYALRELGDERIVAVFNEEFGNCEDLPFDIRHRRWPLRYRTAGADTGDKAQQARKNERKKLTSALVKILETLVKNTGKRAESPGSDLDRPLVEQFPLDSEILLQNSGQRFRIRRSGAKILLSVRSARSGLSLSQTDVQSIAIKTLKPLASRRLSGCSTARTSDGAALFKHPGGNGGNVEFASILKRDGSLYGIDCHHVGRHKQSRIEEPFLSASVVEEILTDGLRNFLAVAENDLSLALPLDVGVALEGVKNHLVVVSRDVYDGLQGPLLVERIEDRFQVASYTANPAELLKLFIGKIYDEAGLEQP